MWMLHWRLADRIQAGTVFLNAAIIGPRVAWTRCEKLGSGLLPLSSGRL